MSKEQPGKLPYTLDELKEKIDEDGCLVVGVELDYQEIFLKSIIGNLEDKFPNQKVVEIEEVECEADYGELSEWCVKLAFDTEALGIE